MIRKWHEHLRGHIFITKSRVLLNQNRAEKGPKPSPSRPAALPLAAGLKGLVLLLAWGGDGTSAWSRWVGAVTAPALPAATHPGRELPLRQPSVPCLLAEGGQGVLCSAEDKRACFTSQPRHQRTTSTQTQRLPPQG